MMPRVVFALLLVVAALMQATILPQLGAVAILPDVVLVLLLVWSGVRGVGEGLIWVFVVGLVLDLLAMDPIGSNGLALLPAALLAGLARRRFFHSGMIFPLMLAMLVTIAHALLLTLLRGLGTNGATLPAAAVVRLTLLQALLNGLLVPPLYLVAGWMDRWMMEKA
jgi:rod shape-determining protein MreD